MTFVRNYISSLIDLLYLYTFGTCFSRNRILVYQIYAILHTFKNPPVAKILAETELDVITPTQSAIQVVEPIGVQGNTTAYELCVINTLINERKPKNIFEIGTFDGRTTLNMAVNAPQDATIYTIDLPKQTDGEASLPVSRSDSNLIVKHVTGARFQGIDKQAMTAGRTIKQLYGDTATFDFTPYYNSIDFVFVDAAHTYEYVKNDSVVALKLLRSGKGMIVWHDYDDKHGGSVTAVNELLQQHPDWKMYHIKSTNMACAIFN